jgi:hypothetical protein
MIVRDPHFLARRRPAFISAYAAVRPMLAHAQNSGTNIEPRWSFLFPLLSVFAIYASQAWRTLTPVRGLSVVRIGTKGTHYLI